MIIAHVDVSFKGFLKKWGLGRLSPVKERLIGWRYVQPLSLEDAAASDTVSLSITRNSIRELPAEDLADALEELSGRQQQAVFSALDSEKAADTLLEAEPRAQRQIVAALRMDRARSILSEMSLPQLADLLSVLPLDDQRDLMALLPPELAARIKSVLSEHETEAASIMSSRYVAMAGTTPVGEALAHLREGKYEHDAISYIYIVGEGDVLQGVVDVREALLAPSDKPLAEIMVAPVVSAEGNDTRDDLAELFAKYHYRMIPIVDAKDHVLGVVHYNDVMKGLVTRPRT
jgi:magnesium transporter